MRVGVTGASGFIGRALTARLAHSGHAVRALTRRPLSLGEASGAAETQVLRSWDEATLSEAFGGTDVVVHLAGFQSGAARDARLVEQANEGIVRAVALACVAANCTLIHVSSVRVYGRANGGIISESSPHHPVSAYGKAKSASERIVRELLSPSRATILEPSEVYGPGDRRGFIAKILVRVMRRARLFPGSGHNHCHPVHIDDCLDAIEHSLSRPVDDGNPIIVAGPAALTIRSLIQLAARKAGVPGPQVFIPDGTLIAAEMACRLLPIISPLDPPLSASTLEVLLDDRRYDTARAEHLLGWRGKIDPAKGVAQTIEWMTRSSDDARRYV